MVRRCSCMGSSFAELSATLPSRRASRAICCERQTRFDLLKDGKYLLVLVQKWPQLLLSQSINWTENRPAGQHDYSPSRAGGRPTAREVRPPLGAHENCVTRQRCLQ